MQEQIPHNNKIAEPINPGSFNEFAANSSFANYKETAMEYAKAIGTYRLGLAAVQGISLDDLHRKTS